MRILILGGSGILSTDFTKKVLDEGNEVYVLNRGRRPQFIDKRCKLIVADIRTESIEELRTKVDTGKYDVVVDFLSFNVAQLKKCLTVISELFEQYIFISSATVYKKENEQQIIDENTPIGNDRWLYAIEKVACEEYLREKDINYTIIRPYVTYGKSRIPFPIIPDVNHYSLLARIIEEKPVVMYEGGKALCTLTSTIDFAEILYKLLLNEKAYKEDFHITSCFTQTWQNVYEEICKLLGKNSNAISVTDKEIAKYMPEYREILLGDKGTNMVFDNSKVLNAIGGYEFKIDLQEGLRQSIDFYLENEFMHMIDYKWEGECDFLIYKLKGIKLTCVNTKSVSSSRKIYYYIMCKQPLRGFVELVRTARRILRNRKGDCK